MAARDVELAIRVAADADNAVASFGDIREAARRAGEDVEDAMRDAERSMDGFESGLDKTASTASMAAGGLGDLAGGLELAGATGAAEQLEKAAVAIQAVAGVADLATVATNLLSISKIKDTAATVAQKTATIASSAATKAAAAAQWLLNAALTANPIGLIILAVVALVAGIVLLYKKSDTFRAIVQKVGEVGKKAIGWIVEKVGDLVEWVKDKAPAAWDKFKTIAVKAFKAIPIVFIIGKLIDLVRWIKERLPAAWDRFKTVAVRVFDLVTAPLRKMLGWLGDVRDFVQQKVPEGLRKLRDIGSRALDALLSPFETIKDVIDSIKDGIDWLLDKLPTLDLGGLGDLVGLSSAPALATAATTTAASPAAPSVVFQITAPNAVDPDATARSIGNIVEERLRRLGLVN